MNRQYALAALVAVAIAAAPLALQAQQAKEKTAHIGILVTGSAAQRGHLEQALLDGLREQGFVEGKNLVIERRYADGHRERMPGFARELAGKNLDAVIATCTPTTRAAKQATSSTPIVMAAVADPVGQRLIASLAKPGGNVTGLSSQTEDILPKMMEIFSGILPRQATVAVFLQGGSEVHPRMWEQLVPIARSLKLNPVRIDVAGSEDLPAAFDRALQAKADAVLVLPDEPMFLNWRARVVELAARHRLPAFYGAREFVDDGGLISYGENLRNAHRSAATYVAYLVRGAQPASLPVQQPTRFELVVNLKTAKALGMKVPQAILLRADQVIE